MKTYFLPLVCLSIFFTSCSNTEIVEEEELFESTALVDMTTPEEELFDLVNEHRISVGLPSLKFSPDAYVHATAHNAYMIVDNRLSHDNFSARASSLAAETNAVFVGENVARDFTTNMAVLNGWLSSDSHRNTVEGDFTHSAVSIMLDGEGTPYYTQLFFRK